MASTGRADVTDVAAVIDFTTAAGIASSILDEIVQSVVPSSSGQSSVDMSLPEEKRWAQHNLETDDAEEFIYNLVLRHACCPRRFSRLVFKEKKTNFLIY